MPRSKKYVNNSCLPDHEIEAIVRCIYPDIIAFYETEEGQRGFAAWMEKKRLTEERKDREAQEPEH